MRRVCLPKYRPNVERLEGRFNPSSFDAGDASIPKIELPNEVPILTAPRLDFFLFAPPPAPAPMAMPIWVAPASAPAPLTSALPVKEPERSSIPSGSALFGVGGDPEIDEPQPPVREERRRVRPRPAPLAEPAVLAMEEVPAPALREE